MNKVVEAVLNHVRKQADLNQDGRVDRADWEVAEAAIRAEAEEKLEQARQFANVQIGELVERKGSTNAVLTAVLWTAVVSIVGTAAFFIFVVR